MTITAHAYRRRGIASVLALLFLALMVSLGLAFFTTTDMELRKAENLGLASKARMAAESGMSYVLWTLKDCRSESLGSGKPDMLAVVHAHLQEKLAGSEYQLNFVGEQLEPNVSSDQRYVTLAGPNGGIKLGGVKTFSARFYIADWGVEEGQGEAGQDVATTIVMAVRVSGEGGGLMRTVDMQCGVQVDRSILHYAVASAPRVILRGKANINGDICTSWRRIVGSSSSKVAWGLDVGSPDAGERANEDIQITGRVTTTLSENRFDGTIDGSDPTYDPDEDWVFSRNSWDAVRHENVAEKVEFDEPNLVDDITHEDFDTSMFRDRPDDYVLHSPKSSWGDSWKYEYFSNVRIRRANYKDYNGSGSKSAFVNLKIPKGRQAHFKNCVFKGITYIETNESTSGTPSRSSANNIHFEDCTFEGPIVTGVAKKFAWERNAITFTGNTVFHASMIQETLKGTTILAPNFNINIGDFNQGNLDGDSKIVGILVGGIVDIRDNATVEGTILSMANLDFLSSSSCYLYGSNIGNWEGGGETSGGGGGIATSTISITPDPDNVMPLGIKRKYIFVVNCDSYTER